MTVLHVPVRELPRPSQAAHGDQWEWGALVPSAWAALADPAGVHPWPAFPTDESFTGAWFTPAMHLLAYAVGWPRLDLGASWWQRSGFPTDEPALAVVSDMLGDRRDELIAWILTSWAARDLATVIADATETTVPTAIRPSIDQAWLATVESVARPDGPYAPGNGDSLHLSTHGSAPIWESGSPSRATWLVGPPAERRAVLVVDSYLGWYRTLARLGASLPGLPGDRSWRVDVVCTPVGHLGTYRRSRLTGRWFSTRHRVHQEGWESD